MQIEDVKRQEAEAKKAKGKRGNNVGAANAMCQ